MEQVVYQYGELSEAAQEKAREWYAGCLDLSSDELDIDFLSLAGRLLGITFNEKNAHYSIDIWNRGACYFCIDGIYQYKKGWKEALKREFGGTLLHDLQKIGQRLQDAQRRAFYSLTACLDVSWRNNQRVDIDDTTPEIEEEIKEAIIDFTQFCENYLVDFVECIYSEESIEDAIIANEYTFNEEGNPEMLT